MTPREAHALLDAARAGDTSVTTAEITRALIATGDFGRILRPVQRRASVRAAAAREWPYYAVEREPRAA